MVGAAGQWGLAQPRQGACEAEPGDVSIGFLRLARRHHRLGQLCCVTSRWDTSDMGGIRVPCLFCFSGEARLSREHLLSVPVCRGFGIDRSMMILSPARPKAPPVPLDQIRVRIACQSCNSGWMNDLENRIENEVAWPWYRHRTTRLGTEPVLVLRAWALKSYLVWSAFSGGIRTFAGPGEPQWAVVPDPRRARLLFEGRWEEAVEGVTFGLARVKPGLHLWGFGNPEVVPKGSNVPNARSAGVLGLNLGELQVWVVSPVFSTAAVRFPPHVVDLTLGLSFVLLEHASPNLEPTRVTVDNSGGRHLQPGP
jgi:hypothetical protein